MPHSNVGWLFLNKIQNVHEMIKYCSLREVLNYLGIKNNNLNDFYVYPFGSYNREFIEKIVLPYESIGIEGLDIQLCVLITCQEQEIYSIYKNDVKTYNTALIQLNEQKQIINIIPVICMVLSLIIIVVALFVIRLSAFYCNQKQGE